jgi:hypothetical protein
LQATSASDGLSDPLGFHLCLGERDGTSWIRLLVRCSRREAAGLSVVLSSSRSEAQCWFFEPGRSIRAVSMISGCLYPRTPSFYIHPKLDLVIEQCTEAQPNKVRAESQRVPPHDESASPAGFAGVLKEKAPQRALGSHDPFGANSDRSITVTVSKILPSLLIERHGLTSLEVASLPLSRLA